jgi:hypothetical protein
MLSDKLINLGFENKGKNWGVNYNVEKKTLLLTQPICELSKVGFDKNQCYTDVLSISSLVNVQKVDEAKF